MSKNEKQEKGVEIKTGSGKIKEEKVLLIALQNTQLPDGTFIGKGETCGVGQDYADRVLKEKNAHFRLK